MCNIPNNAITHSGKFHADDVFSAALLKMINKEVKIERVASVSPDFDGIVFDIGMGKYDHHQKNNEKRKNGMPYAAFGKLWREFAPSFLSKNIVYKMDREFVQYIDFADNGGQTNLLSIFISKLNPNWDEKEGVEDEYFEKAVAIAQKLLSYKIKFEEYKEQKEIKTDKENNKSINELVNYAFAKPLCESMINDRSYIYASDINSYINGAIKRDSAYDKSGNLCCSLSLVWEEYGSLVTDITVVGSVRRSFFSLLDGVVKNNNTNDLLLRLFYDIGSKSESFKKFSDEIVTEWIKTEIRNAESKLMSREILINAIQNTSDDEIIVLDQFCPWREILINSLAKFVVYPSARGGYNMHTVPISKENPEPRLSFPKEWLGQTGNVCEKIPDIIFCHKGNFLLTSKSIDGCFAAAEFSSRDYVSRTFSGVDCEILSIIEKSSNAEYDINNIIKNYSVVELNELIEKLRHVYYKDAMVKQALQDTIKALTIDINKKKFWEQHSIPLEKILENL